MKKLLARLFNFVKPAMCGHGTKPAECFAKLRVTPAVCMRAKAKVGQCMRPGRP